MVHGGIPVDMLVDHINRNPFDNRIENLRLATRSQNQMNRKPQSNNALGLKGVSFDRGRYEAVITTGGHRIKIGRYATKGLAAVAYAKAALRYHGQFARITN